MLDRLGGRASKDALPLIPADLPMTDIALLKTELQGLKIEDNPAIVKQKSRDFFWYSPVLKRQLDHVTADLLVSPKDEIEVIRVLEACYRLGVPVTPRGSGTGNYGQAMPLAGGVVLSLADMNRNQVDRARARDSRGRHRARGYRPRDAPGAGDPPLPLDLQHRLRGRLHRRWLGRLRVDQLGRSPEHRQRARPPHRHHGGEAACARFPGRD